MFRVENLNSRFKIRGLGNRVEELGFSAKGVGVGLRISGRRFRIWVKGSRPI